MLLLFKCLADRSRLRIVQSLLREDMYVELLSQRLGLTPATISFHLKKLEEAGLVTSRPEQYYTMYALRRERLTRGPDRHRSSPVPGGADRRRRRRGPRAGTTGGRLPEKGFGDLF